MKRITDFLEKLIAEHDDLAKIAGSNVPSSRCEFERDFTRWTLSGRQVLTHAGLEPYLSKFNTAATGSNAAVYKLPEMTGILESALECLNGGLVGQLRYLLHAEMFDSLTAQANELLASGHRTPAAVLARIVIERWLRDQGEKAGVPDWQTAKASSLNDALKSAEVFAQPKWRLIQSHLDVGNAAAHGKESAFTADDVKRMIDFAESNCV